MKRHTLPNGLGLYHFNKGETDVIYREIWEHDAYLDESRGVVLEPGMMQADGIHPTTQAQPYISELVWRKLQPML